MLKIFFSNPINRLSFLIAFVISAHPLNFYLNSIANFTISLDLILLRSVEIFLIVFILAMGLLFLLKRIFSFTHLCSIFLILTILLWLQGYIFLWNYGIIDGTQLNYSENTLLCFLELLIWIAGIFVSFKYSKFIFKSLNVFIISLIFLISSAIFVCLLSFSFQKPWHKTYSVDWEHLARFSSKKNIIVLIIDSARADIFSEILSELAIEDRDLLKGFTFFNNVSGASIATVPSVPAILAEKMWDRKKNFYEGHHKIFRSSNSVLHRLKNKGFVVDVYPYAVDSVSIAPDICSNLQRNSLTKDDVFNDFSKLKFISKFQFSPHFLKTYLFPTNSTNFLFFPQSEKNSKVVKLEANPNKLPPNILDHIKINSSRIQEIKLNAKFIEDPVFKYIHFHGAHHPYFHDEKFEPVALPETVESYKKQFTGSLLVTMRALIQTLKKNNVYDQSMIIVAGDHGAHITDEAINIIDLNSEFKSFSNFLNPMILVKPFNASNQPIVINSSQASLFDIPATVFDALHYEYSGDYFSLFKIDQKKDRSRLLYIPYETYIPHGGILAEVKIDGNINDLNNWKLTGNCIGNFSYECNDKDMIMKKINDWSNRYNLQRKKKQAW
jgi:hypothetical protein